MADEKLLENASALSMSCSLVANDVSAMDAAESACPVLHEAQGKKSVFVRVAVPYRTMEESNLRACGVAEKK
jgi:hypothetical protein